MFLFPSHDQGEKVLIYSKLRSTVDYIGEALTDAKIPYARITGTENQEQRDYAQLQISDLAGKDNVDIVLGTKAMQKGLDGLKIARHLILYDCPWSYGLYRQLLGRLKRTGSINKRIVVYRMLSLLHPEVALTAGGRKTIDHHVLETVLKKYKLWAAITDDTESIEDAGGELKEIWQAIKEAA